MSMLVTLLIMVIVGVVILALVKLALDHLPIGATMRNVIYAVVILILLIVFLERIGVFV